MLATVGWVDAAGAAPLSGVQAVPVEMDRAVETDGCSRDGPAKLGLSVGVEGSVLAVTDTPGSTDAAGAEVVSMEVEVAVDGDGCSLVERAGGVGAGMRRSTSACHSGCAWDRGCGRPRAVRCRQGRQ